MNIGERIKYVRMLRGMRQEELAGKIGLGYNANGRTRISQYENGKRTPKKRYA
ncbi:helix-turn-helix transcriptional regulator [Thomasclavelia spiroformis]|uniref:helix-turn-helix domain-containing protein n=1 Tax=Thomasclavelia spiroformis TaxID=29348 RepID=UPI0030B88381